MMGVPQAPGTITSLRYLGRDEPAGGGRYPMAVFAVAYRSATAGGARIGAKLHIPLGPPPHQGWPVSVWSHGLGDPAMDFRRWPFVGDNWRNARGTMAGRWAHDGIVTLTPWLPGAGPSEPFATWSPFSLPRNAQALADGFLALRNLEQEWSKYPDAGRASGVTLRLNHHRQLLRTDCVSSATLMQFAAQQASYPQVSGLRALVADDFQPSLAYVTHFLGPRVCSLETHSSAAVRCAWARNTWSLAEERQWPLTTFFSESAIQLFSQPVKLPLGMRPRIYALRISPSQSELAPLVVDAATQELGRKPNGTEIRDWMYSPAMARWMSLPSLESMIIDDFYRTYLATSDPFFAETIKPFASKAPLFIVGRGDETPLRNLPSLAERHRNMTVPRIHTLRAWGWDVRVYPEESDGGTSFSGGPAQSWVIDELRPLLCQ